MRHVRSPRPRHGRVLPVLLAAAGLAAAAFGDPTDLDTAARRAAERGDFSTATTRWQEAITAHRAGGDPAAAAAASVGLAGSLQAMGRQLDAIRLLEKTLAAPDLPAPSSARREAKARLGGALLLSRDLDRAGTLLSEALEESRGAGDERLAATILNDRGNLRRLQAEPQPALADFSEAASIADRLGAPGLASQALVNAAATALASGQHGQASEFNARALAGIAQLPASHASGFLLLTAAATDAGLARADASAAKPALLRAHQALSTALQQGRDLGDGALEARALDGLARLYQSDGQPGPALEMARRSAFAAQRASSPDTLYRAEWLIGRLLRAKGDEPGAVAAYRRAVQSLEPIRHDLALAHGNAVQDATFRESQGPLFLELADLLLREAGRSPDAARHQALLREARDTVEQLKAVELEDYLQDECVNVLRSRARPLDSVAPRTAVVYLVPLPDRTELLVGIGSTLHRFPLEIDASRLEQRIRDFRRHLETRTSHAYLTEAQELHRWLIGPMLGLLAEHEVDTLVFVPDGVLRTVPMAALHDGTRFLVEDFAVAVAPGLTLLEPRPLAGDKTRVLLGGLTNAVQGFPPLYFVGEELDTVGRYYRGRTLSNESFTEAGLKQRMSEEQFSMVHLASHGQFDRDVRNTFLLTYDGKLTLSDLEAMIRPSQYRGRPVELLVLSACQTAAGDDRAALGLAGVAVKAGARSALASLWFVNDQSTSALVSELYAQLQADPSLSKAHALQAAQRTLLADRRFRHPCYWSPYLVVGNWL